MKKYRFITACLLILLAFLLFNIFNETVINPPAELGRLTDAGGGEQSIKIENSAV